MRHLADDKRNRLNKVAYALAGAESPHVQDKLAAAAVLPCAWRNVEVDTVADDSHSPGAVGVVEVDLLSLALRESDHPVRGDERGVLDRPVRQPLAVGHLSPVGRVRGVDDSQACPVANRRRNRP
jgi:hypothetical protein